MLDKHQARGKPPGEILALQKRPWVLCLDEFPYLTAVDASLPSQVQKWLGHSLPRGCLLIVAGCPARVKMKKHVSTQKPLREKPKPGHPCRQTLP